jgi:hypothetical protein
MRRRQRQLAGSIRGANAAPLGWSRSHDGHPSPSQNRDRMISRVDGDRIFQKWRPTVERTHEATAVRSVDRLDEDAHDPPPSPDGGRPTVRSQGGATALTSPCRGQQQAAASLRTGTGTRSRCCGGPGQGAEPRLAYRSARRRRPCVPSDHRTFTGGGTVRMESFRPTHQLPSMRN